MVVGVPSNDFGAQEPGKDADVQKVYSKDMHLRVPQFDFPGAIFSEAGKKSVPCPCRFRAARTALHRKQGKTCHLLPSKLL